MLIKTQRDFIGGAERGAAFFYAILQTFLFKQGPVLPWTLNIRCFIAFREAARNNVQYPNSILHIEE